MYKNSTKLLILMQMLDLLTTLVGIQFLGLVERNPLLIGWDIESLIMLKLIAVCFMVILMEQHDYGWLEWIPSAVTSIPVFGNIYMILSVL